MIRTQACLICGSRRLRRSPGKLAPFIADRCRIDPDAAPVERLWCPSCDLLFFDQRLDQTEVQRLYLGYRDPAYVLQRTRSEPNYADRHPDLVDVGNPNHRERIAGLRAEFAALGRPLGRVLDYGGGDGWLTRAAFPEGDIVVYDLMDGVAPPPEGGFDLVVCAHVLEHVSFPVPLVRDLAAFLRPGGLLYLEVPGPGRRAPGAEVFDYMGPALHEHVSFFSARAMFRLLHRCGLQAIQTVAIADVTKVFARRASDPLQPLLAERYGPGRLPLPVRGPRGTDTRPRS